MDHDLNLNFMDSLPRDIREDLKLRLALLKVSRYRTDSADRVILYTFYLWDLVSF